MFIFNIYSELRRLIKSIIFIGQLWGFLKVLAHCLEIKSKNSLPELTSVIEVTVLSSQKESSYK